MAIAESAIRPEPLEPVILALPKRITERILIALAAKNPEYRFETMADGRLVVSPLTGTFASFAEGELLRQLTTWNDERRLGRVSSSSGGITLADGAIKGPDAAFFSNGRLAALKPGRKKRAFEQIAPDVVFEILSPTNRSAYTVAKCHEYVDTGSSVAVLLDQRARSVTLYRKGIGPSVIAKDIEAIRIGDEMQGFVLDAGAVFSASELPHVSET